MLGIANKLCRLSGVGGGGYAMMFQTQLASWLVMGTMHAVMAALQQEIHKSMGVFVFASMSTHMHAVMRYVG